MRNENREVSAFGVPLFGEDRVVEAVMAVCEVSAVGNSHSDSDGKVCGHGLGGNAFATTTLPAARYIGGILQSSFNSADALARQREESRRSTELSIAMKGVASAESKFPAILMSASRGASAIVKCEHASVLVYDKIRHELQRIPEVGQVRRARTEPPPARPPSAS